MIATHNLNWVEMFPGRILRFEEDEVTEIGNLSAIDTVKFQMIADNDEIVEEKMIVDDDHYDSANESNSSLI